MEGVLRSPAGEEFVLFFEIPRAQARWVTRRADPFVVVFIQAMMKLGAPVRVRGAVTARTLEQLAEYQRVVARWHPGLLRVVDIQADDVVRPRRAPRHPRPLLAFSGGTDSMFSAWSWTQPERRHSRLTWAVMAHGFDVGQDEREFFARQLSEGQAALATRGINLFAVRNNCMWMSGILGLKWGIHFHGTATAALMLLFQDRFDLGVLSSTYVCDNLHVPWGSTPLTDPLLGKEQTFTTQLVGKTRTARCHGMRGSVKSHGQTNDKTNRLPLVDQRRDRRKALGIRLPTYCRQGMRLGKQSLTNSDTDTLFTKIEGEYRSVLISGKLRHDPHSLQDW